MAPARLAAASGVMMVLSPSPPRKVELVKTQKVLVVAFPCCSQSGLWVHGSQTPVLSAFWSSMGNGQMARSCGSCGFSRVHRHWLEAENATTDGRLELRKKPSVTQKLFVS